MKQRTPLLAVVISLPVLLALTATCPAQDIRRDIRKDRTMQVKPNSIWFQDQAQLTRWQQIKKSGDEAALKSYQDGKLGNRDAWQFINQMTVRVVKYNAARQQVDLEMKTPGRMQGSTWIVDADAIQDSKR